MWSIPLLRAGSERSTLLAMDGDRSNRSTPDRAPTVVGPLQERSDPVTEQRHADRGDLDLRPTRPLLELINDEDASVPGALRQAAPALAAAIDAIVARLRLGG